VAWRLLPTDRQAHAVLGEVMAGGAYTTEARGPEAWPDNLKTVADLGLGADGVTLSALIRDGERSQTPLPDADLRPNDILVLVGEQQALERVFARTPLTPSRTGAEIAKAEPSEEIRSIEAVVQPGSVLIGKSARRLHLQEQYGVNLLAVAREGERITERLRAITLRAGDMLVLQAGERALPDAMKELKVLPLAPRDIRLGGIRRKISPVLILTLAMVLVAPKIAPVAIAFFGAAVLMVAVGALSMREAYDSLEGQVLVLIGALTPLSEAVRATGGTDLIAHGMAGLLAAAPPLLALGALLVTAMVCSPFLHNAPTVLVLAPIGVVLAQQLHLNPDAFLMAVAVGAGCDFLTPIGHQCNTLVMGPGGYRFGDYWRLGLPLSLLVILVGTPLIAHVWRL
jgi:di/tricarboxylate transporter